jgi:Kef-type K+ transport system membrane component KefB
MPIYILFAVALVVALLLLIGDFLYSRYVGKIVDEQERQFIFWILGVLVAYFLTGDTHEAPAEPTAPEHEETK